MEKSCLFYRVDIREPVLDPVLVEPLRIRLVYSPLFRPSKRQTLRPQMIPSSHLGCVEEAVLPLPLT